MPRVPNYQPAVAPIADQGQFQRAAPVDNSGILQGLQTVAGALTSAGKTQLAEQQRKQREEENLRSVRLAQDGFRLTSGTLQDETNRLLRTSGEEAANSLDAFDRASALSRDSLLDIEDLAAQTRAIQQYDASSAVMRARIAKHDETGKLQEVQLRSEGLVATASDLVLTDPDSAEGWKQAKDASDFKMDALALRGVQVTDAMRKRDLHATELEVATKYINSLLGEQTIDAANQAEAWLRSKPGRDRVHSDDARLALFDKINSRRHNMEARAKREQVETDARGIYEYTNTSVTKSPEEAADAALNGGAMSGMSSAAKTAVLQTIAGHNARAEAEAQTITDTGAMVTMAQAVENGEPMTWQQLIDTKASPAMIERVMAGRLGEAKAAAQSDEQIRAIERVVNLVADNGPGWVNVENLTAAGIPQGLQTSLLSAQLSEVMTLDERTFKAAQAREAAVAEGETFNDLWTKIGALKHGESLSSEDSYRLGKGVSGPLNALLQRRLKIRMEAVAPGAKGKPQYKETLDALISKGGRLHGYIVKAADADNTFFSLDRGKDKKTEAFLEGRVLDDIENHMESLPVEERTPENLQKYIDTTLKTKMVLFTKEEFAKQYEVKTPPTVKVPVRTADSRYRLAPPEGAVKAELDAKRKAEPQTPDGQDILDEADSLLENR